MIEILFRVRDVPDEGIDVRARTDIAPGASEEEKAIVVGLCQAANAYMRANGYPAFDCLAPFERSWSLRDS